MYAVIVCMDCVISKVKFLELPLAMVTIIVSPIARDIPKTKEEIMPDKAAGITTRVVTSNFVATNPNAPSIMELGSEEIASSDMLALIGIIIIRMTFLVQRILVGLSAGKICSIIAFTNVTAKKPNAIVSIPASISNNGLIVLFTLSDAYSLK